MLYAHVRIRLSGHRRHAPRGTQDTATPLQLLPITPPHFALVPVYSSLERNARHCNRDTLATVATNSAAFCSDAIVFKSQFTAGIRKEARKTLQHPCNNLQKSPTFLAKNLQIQRTRPLAAGQKSPKFHTKQPYFPCRRAMYSLQKTCGP